MPCGWLLSVPDILLLLYVNVKYIIKATLMQFNQHNCSIIAASKNVTTPCMCQMSHMMKKFEGVCIELSNYIIYLAQYIFSELIQSGSFIIDLAILTLAIYYLQVCHAVTVMYIHINTVQVAIFIYIPCQGTYMIIINGINAYSNGLATYIKLCSPCSL